MEAWLEAYRQQRRDQWDEDPVELEEPTRAMLMAEVRRQHPADTATEASDGQESPEPTLGWLRWALGGMTVAIVALGVSSLSNFNNSNTSDSVIMTQADPAGMELADQAAMRDAAAGIEKAKKANEAEESGHHPAALKSNHAGQAKRGMEAAPSVATTGNEGPAGGFAGAGGETPTMRTILVGELNQNAPGNYYNNAREMQLRFAQQSRARNGAMAIRTVQRQKQLPKPVLVNFELRRVGNTIQVMDGDGSVYTGNVINEEAKMLDEAAQPPVALNAAAAPGGGSGIAAARVSPQRMQRNDNRAFFRVQGTNKTLQQLVILEATLDNSVLSKKETAAKGANKPARPNVAAPAQPEPTKSAGGEGGPQEGGPQLNRKMDAIRAIARMRVLGNARIGKENYAVDAYLDTRAAGKAPSDSKKK